jgi:hypothetical protein
MDIGQDLFRSAPQPDREAMRRVKDWAAQCLLLGEEDNVMVTELRCHEPGCPPLETVIAVLRRGQPTVQAKVHRAAASLTLADVQAACAALSIHSTQTENQP